MPIDPGGPVNASSQPPNEEAVQPLPEAATAWAAVAGPDRPWTEVVVLPQVSSTNAELVAYAQSNSGHGRVLVAEEQTDGRGRLDRTWVSPPGRGLTFSVLAALDAPAGAMGWAPLLAGLGVAEGVEAATGLAPTVKWPNDVMVDDRKLAGLLTEVVPPDRLVIGVGLNTHLGALERPTPQATSLLLEGVPADRADRAGVLIAVLGSLAERLAALAEGPSVATMTAYRERCSSLGQHVRVERAGRPDLQGRAVDIADDASLIVDVVSGGAVHVASGDVVHLR